MASAKGKGSASAQSAPDDWLKSLRDSMADAVVADALPDAIIELVRAQTGLTNDHVMAVMGMYAALEGGAVREHPEIRAFDEMERGDLNSRQISALIAATTAIASSFGARVPPLSVIAFFLRMGIPGMESIGHNLTGKKDNATRAQATAMALQMYGALPKALLASEVDLRPFATSFGIMKSIALCGRFRKIAYSGGHVLIFAPVNGVMYQSLTVNAVTTNWATDDKVKPTFVPVTLMRLFRYAAAVWVSDLDQEAYKKMYKQFSGHKTVLEVTTEARLLSFSWSPMQQPNSTMPADRRLFFETLKQFSEARTAILVEHGVRGLAKKSVTEYNDSEKKAAAAIATLVATYKAKAILQ